ncbi:MAG TPA: hypothetical protein VEQ59_11225 [Polyangiaceae bacterium]|nr:hypothetical protein [Polyangiaceae bacterium]
MTARALIFVGLGTLLGSCSLIIDVDGKQCSADQDCAALGSAFAGSVCERNVCVPSAEPAAGEGAGGSPELPVEDPLVCRAPEPSATETVTFSFAPIFLAGTEPKDPQPFSVKACDQFDFDCEAPIVGPVDVAAGERYDFALPKGAAGFSGYFEITNPDTLSGLFFMGRPIVEDTVGWNVTMPSPNLVAQLALLTGEEVDPELGLILSVARDCSSQPLAGVTVTNTKGGLGYYFVMSVPDTSLGKTGPQGAFGFANVPLLPTSLSGVHESGKELGPVSVRVKPHFISFAEIFP